MKLAIFVYKACFFLEDNVTRRVKRIINDNTT